MESNKVKQKKTLVLGASTNPERYAYKAAKKLLMYGHEVVAIGRKPAETDGFTIIDTMPHIENLHTVTLYLNAANQKAYYDYILKLQPERIIFNPGAENDELVNLVMGRNIETVEACTLVMLSTGQY